MGIYEDRILPRLVHFSVRQAPFAAYRRWVVPAAEGRVLAAREMALRIALLEGSAEAIPLEDASVDTVVTTFMYEGASRPA